MQARSLPPDQQKAAAENEKEVRGQLKKAADALEKVKKELLLNGSTAAGGATDKLFKAQEDRRRAQNVTNTLQRGDEKLTECQKVMAETEQVGVETLQELRRQREVQHKIQDHTANLRATNA